VRLVWVLLLALLFLQACEPEQSKTQPVAPATSVPHEDEVSIADLPVEARKTLRLIKQGGPFHYSRDSEVFSNYEQVLPKQVRGYYHEYTVKTPGAHNRGAHRIVAGRPGEYYYSADHYKTFKRIRE
jgi:ribonuclease T1